MGKKLDVAGQKFFNLTAIKEVGKNKNGKTMWEFLCDCGETVVSSVTSVKRGNRKSCGCARKEALIKRNKERLNDLTSKVFGKLTAIKRVGTSKSGNAMWECSCSCGGSRVVSSGSLVSGSVKSCGCIREEIAKEMVINITGQKFHRLTALRMVGFDKSRNAQWEFQCECGKRKVISGCYVREGKIKSCGCLQKELYEENKNDVIGKRFGRLLVLKQVESKNKRLRYECLCDCGRKSVVLGQNLVNSHTTSCGCYGREVLERSHIENTKHGMIDTPEYQCWSNMRNRCNNPNSKDYHNYGERGITICEEWNDFEKFLADMGTRPHPDLTLERRDNDMSYSPDNCVWATRKEQANNRRTKEECERDRVLMRTA